MAQLRRRDVDFAELHDRRGAPFRLNVAAPEFVPTAAQLPITGYFHSYVHYIDGSTGAWICVGAPDQDIPISVPAARSVPNEARSPKSLHQKAAKEIQISDEAKNKIIKQAEYMFSDISMLANETLVKYVSKDPEGFVPINFVTTLKKLKSLNVSNQTVAHALSFSTKLEVSDDGKKVRRRKPFTEKEKEDLQLRTIIAENLPDDHSHQKIEKIFNAVGSIRSIRICQPQDPKSRSSKGDAVVSNKLHALVEYENVESAEKAAEKLNDERNWRKGMRVRVMLRRSPRSVLKSHKSEFDACAENEGLLDRTPEEPANKASTMEPEGDANSGAPKHAWSRRPKAKPQPQASTTRGLPTPSAPQSSWFRGPRMPDGTRGFTMGRGKPLAANT